MFGIIEANEKNEITLGIRRVLYRARMHTVLLSPDLEDLPYSYPLRALIIPCPEQLPNLELVIARIRARFPDLPLALFARENANRFVYRRYADFVYEDTVFSSTVIDDLLSAYRQKSGKSEHRIAGGLCLARDDSYATIFGLPVPYTHTEWMLLFYLLQIHPRAASAAELACVCFPPDRKHTEHSAVSLLSQIRVKTRASFPATALFVREGSCYRLFG